MIRVILIINIISNVILNILNELTPNIVLRRTIKVDPCFFRAPMLILQVTNYTDIVMPFYAKKKY